MTPSPALHPSVGTPAPGKPVPQRRVVDAPTRMFHWLFALSFLGAYLSADGERWRALHVTLGYTLAGLLAFRVLYGLFGPRHARLGALLRKLRGAPAWLRATADGLRQGRTQGIAWRQGQNLAMALAVFAMLVLVVPLTLSGYGTFHDWGVVLGGDWLEEVHEFFGNAFLATVLAHLALITGLSLLRRRNQATPMFTGRVDGAGPDLVQRNHAWLAAALLVAVMAFVAWEWQQSPKGLVPVQGSAQASDRHGEDDD